MPSDGLAYEADALRVLGTASYVGFDTRLSGMLAEAGYDLNGSPSRLRLELARCDISENQAWRRQEQFDDFLRGTKVALDEILEKVRAIADDRQGRLQLAVTVTGPIGERAVFFSPNLLASFDGWPIELRLY